MLSYPTAAVALLSLSFALVARPPIAAAQASSPTPPPVVAVAPIRSGTASIGGGAGADTLDVGRGLTALLHAELSARRRLRVVPDPGGTPADVLQHADALAAARRLGASHLVASDLSLHGDSIRVATRVSRTGDGATQPLDTLTVGRDDIPSLVDELADMIADAVVPRTDPVRGGPIFPPPRPSVPFAAVTLYSKAVAARAAGDADTATRLLRQVVSAAPQWEQPKRDLAALRRRP